jgi:hypothetical protein
VAARDRLVSVAVADAGAGAGGEHTMVKVQLAQLVQLAKLVQLVAAVAGLVVLAACGSEPAASDAIEPKLSVIQKEIFEVGCTASSCHSTKAHSGSLILVAGASHQNLVGALADNPQAQKEGLLRVKAGDPDASFLLAKCSAGLDGEYGQVMPFGDPDGLPARKLDALRAWIAAGALDD